MAATKEEQGAKAPFLHVLSDRINALTEALLFVTIIAMVVVTTLQIIFRFFFQALTWSEELSCFLLVLASLLGTAVAFKKSNHISVTFVLDKLPPGPKKVVQTLIGFLGIGFFLIVAYYGAVLMKTEAGQLSPALMVSMKWIYLMYPVTGSIVLLHFVDSIATIWKRS